LALHEFGHVLGLGDLYGPGDLALGRALYGLFGIGDQRTSLTAGDAEGATYIYPGTTVSPTGTFTINGGDAYTDTTAVTIDSAVGGPTELRFRDAGQTWTLWEDYAASRPWTLPGGDGVKTVEAEYHNAAGTLARSDSITLDHVAPFTSDNSDTLPHRTFVLVLSPFDGTSGVASTEYRIDGGDWLSGTSIGLRMSIRHKRGGYSRGAHVVDYRSTDNAGNEESFKSCVVTLGG